MCLLVDWHDLVRASWLAMVYLCFFGYQCRAIQSQSFKGHSAAANSRPNLEISGAVQILVHVFVYKLHRPIFFFFNSCCTAFCLAFSARSGPGFWSLAESTFDPPRSLPEEFLPRFFLDPTFEETTFLEMVASLFMDTLDSSITVHSGSLGCTLGVTGLLVFSGQCLSGLMPFLEEATFAKWRLDSNHLLTCHHNAQWGLNPMPI